jgi:hypothetical protein
MPPEICAGWPRAVVGRPKFIAVIAAALSCLPSAILSAQSLPVHGYITAIHPPDSFEVNGEQITLSTDTEFGPISAKTPAINSLTRDAVQIGAWVEVYGPRDRQAKTVVARTVLFRDDENRELSALAVIERIFSTAPDLVIAADGYHIRVTTATEVKLPHDLKSAADVRAGMWVFYEGKLGHDGLLVASKVHFLSTWHPKPKSQSAQAGSNQTVATPQSGDSTTGQPEIEIDDRRTEIDLHDITWQISKDVALQSRVRRVGMNLIPAYQRRLPEDDPAKIHFEFLAVRNPTRDVESSAEGLILVPAHLAARFKNDDQLAAVMADAMAYSLQQGMPLVFQMNRNNLEWAGVLAATNLIPYAGLVTSSVYTYEIEKALKEQRWRVALELMADAGYDPWQAPEAWRLAVPGKLPADTSKLKYPERAGYQLAILNLMYKKPAPINDAETGPTANSSAGTSP